MQEREREKKPISIWQKSKQTKWKYCQQIANSKLCACSIVLTGMCEMKNKNQKKKAKRKEMTRERMLEISFYLNFSLKMHKLIGMQKIVDAHRPQLR